MFSQKLLYRESVRTVFRRLNFIHTPLNRPLLWKHAMDYGSIANFHLFFLDTEGAVEANQKMVDKIMCECKLELFDNFLYCIIWSDSF